MNKEYIERLLNTNFLKNKFDYIDEVFFMKPNTIIITVNNTSNIILNNLLHQIGLLLKMGSDRDIYDFNYYVISSDGTVHYMVKW